MPFGTGRSPTTHRAGIGVVIGVAGVLVGAAIEAAAD
jgi:hypothetical protein